MIKINQLPQATLGNVINQEKGNSNVHERYDPISDVTEIVHDEDGWLIS